MRASMENYGVLMVSPEHFGVFYKINTHMRRRFRTPVDPEGAWLQWRGLQYALAEDDVYTHVVGQKFGLPDMVFAANAGLISGDDFVLSRFRNDALINKRIGEEEVFGEIFRDLGYRVHTIPPDEPFEGHGDALYLFDDKKTLVCAYGDIPGRSGTYFRTSEKGARRASALIQKEPVMLKLVHPDFYHLDTCFCPIGDYILYYPGAFDGNSQKLIKTLGEPFPVSYRDAMNFVPNGIPLRKEAHWKLITTKPTRELCSAFRERDIELKVLNLSEFHKSGGSARCLVIFL